MIARLGLFLSVVAWGVGQWRETKCCIPFSRGQLDIGNCARGWIFEHHSHSQMSGFSFGVVRDRDPVDSLRFGEDYPMTMDLMESGYLLPVPASISTNVAGVVVGEVWGQRFLTLRHWLVVALFALFNGVLMWLYRRSKAIDD